MKSFLNFLAFIVTAIVGLAQKVVPLGTPQAALGITCNSLDTINNYFAVAKNQFTLPLYNWIWLNNPYWGIYPRSMFDYMDGLVPEVNTSTTELPESYPFGLSNIALSNGTGATACRPTPRVIQHGYINRNFRMQSDDWQTAPFCLTDLQFGWQAQQFAKNLYLNLQNYATVRWADWYRVQNIGMIDTKISTGTGATYDSDTNSDFDFTGVALPTGELDWPLLNCLYDSQTNIGAEPLGYAEGQPLFSLNVGPYYKRKLWQTNTQVRDTVNWADPFQNFTARGINTSINGFIPNLDQQIIRYAADGTTPIYPWLNTDATVGRMFVPNPNYKTVANGGLAVYETFQIVARNIFEVKVRPTGPTEFGGMSFGAINYVGDVSWINNKDMCENPEGTMGYYLAHLAMGAKPVRPEVGLTGLTLARDC